MHDDCSNHSEMKEVNKMIGSKLCCFFSAFRKRSKRGRSQKMI